VVVGWLSWARAMVTWAAGNRIPVVYSNRDVWMSGSVGLGKR